MIDGLVSTIIPVHNRPSMLPQAVMSALKQSYKKIEIIIINDGSTDNTFAVAKQLVDAHECVKVISIPNSGPGIARESGRQIANGEFIQYLDSDDLLDEDKFELQVNALNEHSTAAACYCKTRILIGPEKTIVSPWKRTGEKIDSILPSMLSGRWWGTSTPLYRRTACDAAGPWMDLINEEDWEYDCRIALSYNELCYVNKTLSTERQHDAPRLSNNGATDPVKLMARTNAHLAVIEHALICGFDHKTPEFEHLLTGSFLLSRQCATMGLIEQSKSLLTIVRMHLGGKSNQRKKASLYLFLSTLIGWKTMGKISDLVDRIRK